MKTLDLHGVTSIKVEPIKKLSEDNHIRKIRIKTADTEFRFTITLFCENGVEDLEVINE